MPLSATCVAGGAQGIGSNFIDGEPNVKYLPQRPIQLHESPLSPPPALAPSTAQANAGKYSPGMPSVPARLKSPRATGERPPAAPDPTATTPRRIRLATPSTCADERQDHSPFPSRIHAASSRDRPQSSPAVCGGLPRGNGEEQAASPTRRSPTRGAVAPKGTTGSMMEDEGKQTDKHKPRPRTADGREIEVTRFTVPLLDDPADPAMVAHRC